MLRFFWWPFGAAEPLSEVERLRERLRAVYEGGDLIPLPILKASHISPLALLSPTTSPPTNTGNAEVLDPPTHRLIVCKEASVVVVEASFRRTETTMQSSDGWPLRDGGWRCCPGKALVFHCPRRLR